MGVDGGDTAPAPAGRRVVAVVPAHDEERTIAGTVRSLRRQSERIDRIVVVSDNSSDATAAVAEEAGAEVLRTVGNTAKKAGALNQALAVVLPGLADEDLVLLMDADSLLREDFIAEASCALRDPGVGAVCVAYHAAADHRLLPMLQSMEYTRYRRAVSRRGGRTTVLSGVATLITAGLLRRIAAERGGALPGERGWIYAEDSLTEDFELTLAVQRLGFAPLQPRGCVGITDTMTSLRALHQQRLRWQRGTIETLTRYGWDARTRSTWLRVAAVYLLSLVPLLLLSVLAATVHVHGRADLDLRWSALTLVIVVERCLSVRRLGRRAVLLAALVVPEWLYEAYRSLIYWHALLLALRRGEHRWIAT